MWIFLVLLSFLAYSFSSIFEKKGASIHEDHTSIKMVIWIGFFWGLVALGLTILGLRETSSLMVEMVAETPAILASPIFFALALLFNFFAFKLIPLSIASPISNTEGVFEFIGVVILFFILGKSGELEESLSGWKFILIVLILLLTIILTSIRNKNENQESSRALARGRFLIKNGHFAIIGVCSAFLFAIFDAASSLVDIYFLGELGNDAVIKSMDYLYAQSMVYFCISAVLYFLLWFLEKKPYNPFQKHERSRILGAGLDTVATVTWMLAVALNQIYTNIIISTYCIMTLILSRILLKEKFGRKETTLIIAIIISVVSFLTIEELL